MEWEEAGFMPAFFHGWTESHHTKVDAAGLPVTPSVHRHCDELRHSHGRRLPLRQNAFLNTSCSVREDTMQNDWWRCASDNGAGDARRLLQKLALTVMTYLNSAIFTM